MHTSQHKVLSHNAFVFCCKLFFFYSRIMVRYIDMKNIGYVKRVSDQCVFLFSTSCELPNFPRFFCFFSLKFTYENDFASSLVSFLSSFATSFVPNFVVLRMFIFKFLQLMLIVLEVKRDTTGVVRTPRSLIQVIIMI